jgi:hypothetical protein
MQRIASAFSPIIINNRSGDEHAALILCGDFMVLRLTILHENARRALECGSEAAAWVPPEKAVADPTVLQGSFGTFILKRERFPKTRCRMIILSGFRGSNFIFFVADFTFLLTR